MYAEERHDAIAELVTQRGRVAVADLAEIFDVTTETVRRDLDSLERAGLLRRVHGGAVPPNGLRERSVAERTQARAEYKERIAKAAMRLLPDSGGTILLDAGTTTARLAARLPLDRDLTVVTNSLTVAEALAGVNGIRLEMLGGRVRATTRACVGLATLAGLERLRVDVAFLGVNGFTVAGGLTTPDPDEAAVKAAMVAAARRTVVLADSTKIDRDYLVRFARTDEVSAFVTDDELDHELRDRYQAAGVEVLLG